MIDEYKYDERVTSDRTEALFVVLTILFFLLLTWRVNAGGLDLLAAFLLCVFGFFLFCSLNYRSLLIHLTPESLNLRFGVFTWNVPLDNVGDCRLDDLPVLMRMGGAGIHFMIIRKRYRASLNFLEHPRVVIALKRRAGLVQDISFSTRQPKVVIKFIRDAVSSK